MKNNRIILLIVVLAVVIFAAGETSKAAKKEISIPLRFDDYYTYGEVVEAMQALNKAYPQLTKLEIVGKSEEARAIYAMTINNPKTGKELGKPAIYVDGNIHGNEIQATEVCLYMLDYLLGNYGKNQEVTKLVDRVCFYVIPMVNVDGRYHFMTDANTSSSNRGLRIPKDDDRDGLKDEDFPDDLDGDGNICMMRKKDPFGRLKTDPEDDRLMIAIKPGEKGEWTMLGQEGIDNDGDGRVNEDSEGYVDPNRNWGFDWAPEYVQMGAGDYPFSGVGLKSISEWIYKRTNICLAYSLHNFGGMYLRGPSRKALGAYSSRDVAVYDYIGKHSERMVPYYHYLICWKDLYTTYGDSVEWITQMMGAYGYVIELFASAEESYKTRDDESKSKPGQKDVMSFVEGNEEIRERLKFSDNLVQGELYKPWKPYKHPTYGDIEIGGWVKLSSRLPAPFMLKNLVHRNASAMIFAAKHLPEVKLDVFGVSKIGKNLYRIRTRLVNSRAIPSMNYEAQKVKLYPQDILTLSGKQAKVVAGGKLNNIYTDRVTYKKHKPEVQFLFVPGFGKVEYQFLVSGKGEIKIIYRSRHAGTITKTLKLK